MLYYWYIITQMENTMSREKNISIWSVFEPFDLSEIKELEYYNNVISFPETPSLRRFKGACETLIRKSDDRHHIYIETFRNKGNGRFRMECGS